MTITNNIAADSSGSKKLILNTREDVEKLVGEMLKNPGKTANASVLMTQMEMFQTRVATSAEAINEYCERLVAGDKFPPVDIVATHGTFELLCTNGYHRCMGTKKTGNTHIDAKIVLGSREEAEIMAAGANAAGVVPRTNEDKRSAARLLLSRPERAGWSNNRLALLAKVSPQLIEDVRVTMEKELGLTVRPDKRVAIRNGKPLEMKVAAKRVKAEVDAVDAIVKRVVKAAKDFDDSARKLLRDKLIDALCGE